MGGWIDRAMLQGGVESDKRRVNLQAFAAEDLKDWEG